MGKILIVDDESSVLKGFIELLSGSGHTLFTAGSSEAGLEIVQREQPDLVITDLSLPGMSGLEAFDHIRAQSPRTPVIIMTGHGTMETAIEATKRGAFDYQLKPFDPEAMVAVIDRALEGRRLMERHVELNPGEVAASADAIIGNCRGMQEVFKAIGRVAATDATVLIRGESGTGKELVARAIYQHSLRSTVPLLVVNCVAIPEPLLESELFGHERGAFTGAHARKIGKFEQAQGGTIFLDEIGDIPPGVQAKILRVLQQRTLERVGGGETIQVDVRVLAATNRPLEKAIAEHGFREDLYHRLNVVTIQIPPLRERREDLPSLVEYFLKRYAHELKIERPVVAAEALEAFCTADWTGNVRELEHCIYRTLIFTRGYPIQADDVRRARENSDPAADAAEGLPELSLLVASYLDRHAGDRPHERLLAEVEGLLIAEAMRRAEGNQSQAARMLGLTRPTLHAKLQRFDGQG